MYGVFRCEHNESILSKLPISTANSLRDCSNLLDLMLKVGVERKLPLDSRKNLSMAAHLEYVSFRDQAGGATKEDLRKGCDRAIANMKRIIAAEVKQCEGALFPIDVLPVDRLDL